MLCASTAAAQAPGAGPIPAAGATTGAQGAAEAPASIYDRIWRFAEWYSDDENPVVQRVLFSGRYQHEYALVDSDEGEVREWNVRRMRVGGRVTFLRRFTFHGEAELNPQERDPLYVRVTDFYVQWSRSARLLVTIGKQGVPFTSDGATSSRDLIAIDRSNLANNIWFPQEYMAGVSVSGRTAPWVYRVGVYSSGAANREFGELTGGVFTLGLVGYDFAPAVGMKEAIVTGNYLYQQPDVANTFTRQLEHVVSIHLRLEDQVWGTRADVSTATGYLGQSDLWGVMIMPFVNVTPTFQIVGRYTRLESDQPNGVRLATYESRLVTGRGDRYGEVYLGANYFFYGHRLKLQSGVQIADMDDRADDGGRYSGTAWTTGVRVGW
jgi:phosphate-selective porin OprO/OprP